MFRRISMLAFMTLCVFGHGEMASACSCIGWLSFDENVKSSTFVLLGRVKAQGRQKLLTSAQPEVTYLDVEVVEAYKGTPMRSVVRIWDSYVGTNCGGGLEELTPGTLSGFVVMDSKSPYSMSELWDITGIRPDATDYLLGTCSQYWKTFKTERGAHRYMRRLVQ